MNLLRRIVDRAYGRETQANFEDFVLLQKFSMESRVLRAAHLDEGGRIQDEPVLFTAWAIHGAEAPPMVVSTLSQFDGLLAELSELRTKALLSAAVEEKVAAHA